MTLAFATQPTARTFLTGVSWVDFRHDHAVLLRFVRGAVTDETTLPEREATAQGASFDLASLWLRHVQVLKDEDGMRRCPLDKLFGCLLGKGACAVALFATKPFEKSRTFVWISCFLNAVACWRMPYKFFTNLDGLLNIFFVRYRRNDLSMGISEKMETHP